MNFLLITVDSLRADRLGCNGYGRNTTPFLDSLADDSVFFERAYSPSSHTREAVPSILTGTYPSHAVTRTYRIRKPTVARILSDAGYETGAFVSAPFFTTGKGYDEGFGVFDSEYSRHAPRMFAEYGWEILTNSHYRDGYDVNDALVSFADDADEPFFAWGHYMEPHAPYNRADGTWFGDGMTDRETQMLFRKAKYFPSRVTEGERRALVDAYDNGVRQFDEVMRDLFGRLDGSGLLDGTVVFVTSDHGESLGENGVYAHRQALSPETLRVPLWMYDRDGDGWTETVDSPVSTVDILPTVAEKTDVGVDTETEFDGVPLRRRREVHGEREIRASRYGYIGREKKSWRMYEFTEAAIGFLLPYGILGLFVLSFLNSSVSPMPTEVLLVPLVLLAPDDVFLFASVSTVASVLGAGFAYYIGSKGRFLERLVKEDHFLLAQRTLQEHGVLVVGVSGIAPPPFKLLCLAAGFFGIWSREDARGGDGFARREVLRYRLRRRVVRQHRCRVRAREHASRLCRRRPRGRRRLRRDAQGSERRGEIGRKLTTRRGKCRTKFVPVAFADGYLELDARQNGVVVTRSVVGRDTRTGGVYVGVGVEV